MDFDVNEIGATAFVIARFRALEEELDEPLFHDPYAKLFHDDAVAAVVDQMIASDSLVWPTIRYRTRLFDDFVKAGIAGGTKQVISLGAGLSMRLNDLTGQEVKTLEVDQGEVLAFKHYVLGKAGVEPVPSLACNYLEVDLPAEVEKAGLDLDAPTTIVWEGNTMYLPQDSLLPLIAGLAEAFTSLRLGFDYFINNLAGREFSSADAQALTERIEKLIGATWVAGIPNIWVLEQDMPLRITKLGKLPALREDYDNTAPMPGYDDAADAYGYCLAETRKGG